jgi:hypothetical protein
MCAAEPGLRKTSNSARMSRLASTAAKSARDGQSVQRFRFTVNGLPATIQLFEHAMCNVARLPVLEVVSAAHYITDLTLGLGTVEFDYLK